MLTSYVTRRSAGAAVARLSSQLHFSTAAPAAAAAAPAQPRAAPTRAPRMSGLQKQVLGLYREVLRTARKLNSQEARLAAIDFARDEFHAKAGSVDKLDIQRIEFLLRQGKKRLTLYTDSATKIDSFKSSLTKQQASSAALAITSCRKLQ